MLSLYLNVCRLFDIVQNFTCSSVSNIINTQIIFLYQPLLTVSFNKDFKKQYERVRCQRNFCFFKYYNYSDNGSLFIVRLNIIKVNIHHENGNGKKDRKKARTGMPFHIVFCKL